MPIFQYTALTPAGKTKKGMIDADTARDARVKLRADDVHVTTIKEIARKAFGVMRDKVVRFMKSSTDRPDAKRDVRAVGKTWFGPPI